MCYAYTVAAMCHFVGMCKHNHHSCGTLAAVIAALLVAVVAVLAIALLVRARQLLASDQQHTAQLQQRQRRQADRQVLLQAGAALEPAPADPLPEPQVQPGNAVVRCLDSLLLSCKLVKLPPSAAVTLAGQGQGRTTGGTQQRGLQRHVSSMHHELTQVIMMIVFLLIVRGERLHSCERVLVFAVSYAMQFGPGCCHAACCSLVDVRAVARLV